MKIKSTLYLILVITIFSTSSFLFAEENDDLQAVVKGNSAFGVELYQKLKGKEGNLFFSPYSISTALAMTYAGARGQTEKEMAEVLHFPLAQEKLHPQLSKIQSKLNSIQEKGYIQLNIANSLWLQEGYRFVDEFVNLNKNYYDSELKFVDFTGDTEKARIDINTWVEEKTHDKIKNIIGKGALSPTTRLVLCNAIYFKGTWVNQFEKQYTRKDSFQLTSQDNIQVDMMNQTEYFRYKDFGDFSAIELPYKSTGVSWRRGALSMIVFLPKEIEGLTQFEENLTVANVERWINELRATRHAKVIVSIPKFKTTTEFELASTLSAMGMPGAFNAIAADFSGMTGTKELFINAVIHKAFVDVNEKGTEAAAATAVGVSSGSGPGGMPEPKKFIADHPFVFLIRDNQTGSILFMGRIADPTK